MICVSLFPTQAVDVDVQVWRAGVWSTCQKYLTKPERLQQVKTCFYGCRFLSCVAFDVFWQKAFAWLADLGEKDLVEKLQCFYFIKTEKGWCGEWAGGFTRCHTGRWVGSQPQESWHKHRLRTSMRDLYLPADVVVEKVASLFQSNADQKSIRSETIGDIPAGHWSPACVKEAKFIFKHKNVLCARSGSSWVMRSECSEELLQKMKTPVTESLVEVLRTLYLSEDRAEVEKAMCSLPGCNSKSTPEAVATVLQKFVLTLEEPEATQHWRCPSNLDVDLPGWHGRAICLGCADCATRGCCKHQYIYMRPSSKEA